MDRAYSIFAIKSLDTERRVITGVATTPTPDRVGDVVVPEGVTYKNPLPLLLFHDAKRPVGVVTFSAPTSKGIGFTATIPHIEEPGVLQERTNEAWQSIRAGLIAGVSIGFRPLRDGQEPLKNGGIRFTKTEIFELSLVVVPANIEATISSFKALDIGLAASGLVPEPVTPLPAPQSGVSDITRVVPVTRKDARPMKTITEQIKDFEATRAAKAGRRSEIMQAAGDTGTTLDPTQEQEYDTLNGEIKSIDNHLGRLELLEKENVAAAKVVKGHTAEEAAQSRTSFVSVTPPKLPPGIEFTRMAICKMAQVIEGIPAYEIAKARYPDQPRIQQVLKAAVAGGTTLDATWAGPLVTTNEFAGDFIEFLRPQTVIGKFGTGGIPSLRRIPFNVRIKGQTSGGNGYWVGQGAPKPLTKFDFNAVTLLWTKVAAISVITEELIRFSSPSAEALVRDALASALVHKLDTDFVDPAKAAVANVSPASITNGITPINASGTTAAAMRTDIQALFAPFINANITPSNGVWIMSATRALALSLMMNALAQPEFPTLSMNGGTFLGLPVIVSEYVTTGSSPNTDLIILVNASDIYLADDGQVKIDASREASLQMDDAPTNNSATGTGTSVVSMFQTDSVALRAERFINWDRRRDEAVQYIQNAAYGA